MHRHTRLFQVVELIALKSIWRTVHLWSTKRCRIFY